MINRRFLNYKYYESFTRDLKAGLISKDAIVFIQDETHPCIWTHNKEYLCNSGKSSISGNSLVFDDGFGNSAFTITFNDSKIILKDSKGNTIEKEYLLKSNYVIDDELSSTSKNPVLNKVIVTALSGKQNKLIEGSGISIIDDTISSTLDVEPFVILSLDEFPPRTPSSNKIYIVVQAVSDGKYKYIQYIYRNGQWIATEDAAPLFDLSGYLTKVEAGLIYLPIGDYITEDDLKEYLKNNILPLFESYLTISDAEEIYQIKGDYATKEWVRLNFVKRPEVYTPKQGDLGTDEQSEGQPSTGGTGYVSIIIDTALNHGSTNPVENRVVANALDQKVSLSYLEANYVTNKNLQKAFKNANLDNYVKNTVHEHDLALKQNILTPGNGISIIDDIISCTLDTSVFVIVDELPVIPNINKIYLLLTEENGVVTYTEYRWDGREWHNNGESNPDINLSEYLKSSVAQDTYQLKGSYALSTDLQSYVTSVDHLLDLDSLLGTVNTNLLNNYLTTNEVTLLINDAKTWVTDYFVEKTDVYTPTNVEDEDNPSPGVDPTPGGDPTPAVQEINVDHNLSTTSRNPVENRVITAALNDKQDTLTAGSGITITNNTISCTINHVFLEQESYEALTSYDPNTLYFVYEESEEEGVWHFNDQFPIILTGEWTFGGTFPIILE